MDQDIILEEEVQVHGSQKPADEAKEGEVLHKPPSCLDNPASPSMPPTSSADHTIIDDHAITKEDSKAITEQETIFDMNPFKPTPPDEAAEILRLWSDRALLSQLMFHWPQASQWLRRYPMAYWTPRNFLPPQQVPEVPQPEKQVPKPKRR